MLTANLKQEKNNNKQNNQKEEINYYYAWLWNWTKWYSLYGKHV